MKKFTEVRNESVIHLIHSEDDTEHLVYALFDKDGKIVKSDFEDTASTERWADKNGYVVTNTTKTLGCDNNAQAK